MPPSEDLRARREAVVCRHMDAANNGDYETVVGTFARPRYELMATGQVFEGADRVRQHLERGRIPFPDQRYEIASLRHADDAVVLELDMVGTHLGRLGDLDATGRSFRSRIAAFFVFEPDGDGLVCERVYYDSGEILRQLGLF